MNVDLFFSPDARGGGILEERERVSQAKGVCYTCPVRTECLEFSINYGCDYGIYGGMTPQERHRGERIR